MNSKPWINKQAPVLWTVVLLALFSGAFFLSSCIAKDFHENTETTGTPSYAPSPIPFTPTFKAIDGSVWNQESEEYQFVTVVDVNQALRMINIQTGKQKIYDLGEEMKDFGALISLSENKTFCGYIGLFTADGEHRIIQFSPEEGIPVEIFRLTQTPADSHRWSPKLSPDGQYIAYVVFSGHLGYDWAEFQNIELVRLDDIDKRVQLSSRGGTWKKGGEWSPDGSKISFTDYDHNGLLQVFVTSLPELNTQQISTFDNPKLKPASLQWSPEGSKVVVVFQNQQPVEEINDSHTEVWIFYPVGGKPHKLPLPSTDMLIGDQLYWSEDGRMLLLITASRDENNQMVSSVYWFDTERNQSVVSVTEEEISSLINSDWFGISNFFPLTLDLSEIALVSGNNQDIFRFNARTLEMEPIPFMRFSEPLIITDIRIFEKEIPQCED
ncbi:MAG: hypothetical protein ROW48_18100 [Bellilinea sp.]|jgi:dipeptidyl aminopeptidase/acylaminoacyl peptidase